MATKLKKFEGREVAQSTIRVTNAGDGLSKALAVEPAEYPEGARVYVLLETEVAVVAHKRLDPDTDLLARVHTLKAGTGTVVSQEFASEAIEKQKRLIEEHEGTLHLDLDGDEED